VGERESKFELKNQATKQMVLTGEIKSTLKELNKCADRRQVKSDK
jgi:hypothetical protein